MTDAAPQQHRKEEKFVSLLLHGFLVARRLFLPVIGMMLAFALAFDTTTQSITLFDEMFPSDPWYLRPGYWLTTAHFMVPVIFFASMLTNRAYGAGYAFGQLAASWALVGLLVAFLFPVLDPLLDANPLPSPRVLTAFLVALLISQVTNILVFDQVRGRPWWRAPLFAVLYSGLAFCVIYYPVAKLGIDPWAHQMTVNIAVTAFMAFLLLIPYALLRPLIRPLPGFGGA